ncbi:hypothetical protein RND81_14G164200 [Saponaria officinalis]|uniref:Uncharacterized protein n=1 Tax=Saponaria officinalis TaxID=3572 RepID=A0AAW1GQM8_SAPOF
MEGSDYKPWRRPNRGHLREIILPLSYRWFTPTSASKNKPFGKYLPLKTLEIGHSRSVISLQDCFPKSAILKLWKSRKPLPPKFFSLHNLLQTIHSIFLFPLFEPHQNRDTRDLSSSQKLLGSLNTLIAYVGIDWAMTFIKTSLRTFESNFPCQFCNFLHSLSRTVFEIAFVGCPTTVGSLVGDLSESPFI